MDTIKKVRIPRSAKRRGEQCWAKLLRRVNPRLCSPLAFEGVLLRCGQDVNEADLWPAPDYPLVPLLLEHAGIADPGWGHKRSRQLYILWRYDRDAWSEVARASSADAGWVCDLLPAARRAIDQQGALSEIDCSGAVNLLLTMLDEHLGRRDDRERRQLLDLLYNGVLHRMAEGELIYASASASYTVRRGPAKESGGSEAGKAESREAIA